MSIRLGASIEPTRIGSNKDGMVSAFLQLLPSLLQCALIAADVQEVLQAKLVATVATLQVSSLVQGRGDSRGDAARVVDGV